MKQTAVEWSTDKVLQTNHLKAIFEDEIIQAKEMEKEENKNLYSEEDLKYAFDSSRVRLTFGKERPFVFKKYEDFIKHFKNK
jgi:hypothetical protein